MVSKNKQSGFTIVEIMIATVVLSVILILATTMMIGIGRLYYKGINLSRIQDTARSVNDEVSKHLQLDGVDPIYADSTPNGAIHAYCIGKTRYVFVLNKLLSSSNSNFNSVHVLWRDTTPPGGCAPTDSFLNNSVPSVGTELMASNSHLTEFSLGASPITSPYTLTIGIAYGDPDPAQGYFNGNGITKTCAGGAGDQFCATAHAQSTVVRRLTGSKVQ